MPFPHAHVEEDTRPQRGPHRRGRTRAPDVAPRRDPGPDSFPQSHQHCNEMTRDEMTVFKAPLLAEDSGVALGVEAPGARPATRAALCGRRGLSEPRAGAQRRTW